MRDFEAQLSAILRVYLERGVLALDAVVAENDDQLIHWMRLRKVAFHNLLALDHIAASDGFKWDNSSVMAELLQRVERFNHYLTERIQQRLDAARDDLTKLNGLRKNLGKFRSGQRLSEVFSKSI